VPDAAHTSSSNFRVADGSAAVHRCVSVGLPDVSWYLERIVLPLAQLGAVSSWAWTERFGAVASPVLEQRTSWTKA